MKLEMHMTYTFGDESPILEFGPGMNKGDKVAAIACAMQKLSTDENIRVADMLEVFYKSFVNTYAKMLGEAVVEGEDDGTE